MKDVIAVYRVRSSDPVAAAKAIAIGQSVGNPNVRNSHETRELMLAHRAVVVTVQRPSSTSRPLDEALIEIAYPGANFSSGDGWAFLLSVLMGGQMDIDLIESCILEKLVLSDEWGSGPAYGIDGIRDITHAYDRPLIGGIVKPKQGLTPDELADICWQMADGGVDFIKEDEVLGWAHEYCPLGPRVAAVSKALYGYHTLYAPCVTADPINLTSKIRIALANGATALHINWWSGLGAYAMVRDLYPTPLFFQKSGERIITQGRYSITFEVLCYLARAIGVDFIHAGMLGGYLDEGVDVLQKRLDILRKKHPHDYLPVVPSLSCGMHPGLVAHIVDVLGNDIMVSAGGSIHGHPDGTRAGARAFYQAATGEHGREYDRAVDEWGETLV